MIDSTAKGPDDCAEHMLLQARQKGQEQWTNIYAEVRALTAPSAEPEVAELRAQLATALDRAEMFAQKVRDLEWR